MRLVHVGDARVVDRGEDHLVLALAGGARHGDPRLRVVGAEAADRAAEDGTAPRLPEDLHARVDLARVDQALDADVVLRVGGVVGVARHVAVHAALEVAPVRRRALGEHGLLRRRLELEHVQRIARRGDDAVRAERSCSAAQHVVALRERLMRASCQQAGDGAARGRREKRTAGEKAQELAARDRFALRNFGRSTIYLGHECLHCDAEENRLSALSAGSIPSGSSLV